MALTENDDDLESTLAFLCNASEEATGDNPESVDVEIPIIQGPNGLEISSFPTCSEEEHNESYGGTAIDNENLHLEIQRFCLDYSNKSIENNFAARRNDSDTSSSAPSRDTNSSELYQRLMEIREQFRGSDSDKQAQSPTTDLTAETSIKAPSLRIPNDSSEQEEISTEIKTDEAVENVVENSPVITNSAKPRRKSKKRTQPCNNVAIQSILRIIAPASEKTSKGGSEERERTGSTSSANTSSKLRDEQNTWRGNLSKDEDQDRFSLITSASIHGYDPKREYVPKIESEFRGLASEDFPPLK